MHKNYAKWIKRADRRPVTDMLEIEYETGVDSEREKREVQRSLYRGGGKVMNVCL